jgi:hypothetical protein
VQYDMMRPGGLLRFTEHGDFDREARLPAGADLTSVARLGERLVVADFSGPALWQLDLDGNDARPFGSEDFRAELAAFATLQERLDLLRRALTGSLVALPLIGLTMLYLMGETVSAAPRFVRPDFRAPVARTSPEPVEIRVTEAWRRRLRSMAMLIAAIVVLGIPLLLYLTGRRGLPLWSGAPLAVTVGLLLPVIGWKLHKGSGQRLIVQDASIRVHSPRGEQARALLADCWCDGRTLLVGPRTVALFVGREPVFDSVALQAHVLGLLPPERWVSGGDLQRMQLHAVWRRRPARLLLQGLLLVVLFVVAVIALLV